MKSLFLLNICLFALSSVDQQPLLRAFPEAEGFGAATPGGRGGKVYFVRTLDDYIGGQEDPIPGSFRFAANAKGPRYILFRVSGTITLKADLWIREPYLTVAGQTAPGDGICFRDYMVVLATHDVILRHLRFRSGGRTRKEQMSVGVFGGNNSILDHCSMSWAIDEVMSSFGSVHNLTVQWCIIAEGLSRSYHPKGEHSKGSILDGDGGISIHHSIYAHNSARSPRVNTVVLDFCNNIVYNWGYRGGYTREAPTYVNYVGNYLRAGPSTRESAATDVFDPGDDMARIYLADNYLEGDPEHTANNVLLLDPPRGVDESAFLKNVVVEKPFRVPAVVTDVPLLARDRILAKAGAILPRQDSADARLMEEIRTGTGRIIDSQDEVGGWPDLATAPPRPDSDDDGMPDAWERQNGLDGTRSDDCLEDSDADGYPNLEEFLNGTDPNVPQAGCTLSAKTFLALQELALAQCAQGEAEFNTRRIAAEIQLTESREANLRALDIHIEPKQGGEGFMIHIGERAQIELVRIPAGTFLMGSPEWEAGLPNERPQHSVTISRPFHMAATMTTNQQLTALLGPTERRTRENEENHPAHEVTWYEAVEYCRLLSEKTGQVFRLPTEAEWEYACRAGTSSPFNTGKTITADLANFDGQEATRFNPAGINRGKLLPVAHFPPNAWGLYDMHGNQAQYCQDVAYRTYTKDPVTDPVNLKPDGARVLRGGKATSKAFYIRSAYRYAYAPAVGYGFRVVMETQ